MPQIRPITDLRNTSEISDACHARREPVFITKNGYGDLVVMSMRGVNIFKRHPVNRLTFPVKMIFIPVIRLFNDTRKNSHTGNCFGRIALNILRDQCPNGIGISPALLVSFDLANNCALA